ncbi:MAG: hypothetical protein ACKPKO_44700 [Candidatus Fonsibacter sp.]
MILRKRVVMLRHKIKFPLLKLIITQLFFILIFSCFFEFYASVVCVIHNKILVI